MKKFLILLLLVAVGAGLYAALMTDSVSDMWLDNIKEHAAEHNPKKGDLWEAENQYQVGRYCQTLGNGARAMVIYQDIIEKFPETLPAQMAEFRLAQCYETIINYVTAKEKYLNCANNYPDFKDSEWAHKAQGRYNDIIANRI